MAGFVRVSGYSQKDIDNAYDRGYADGQVHPGLTTQTLYPYTEGGEGVTTTVTFRFAHRVVGLVSWDSFFGIRTVNISGNSVTVGGRYYHDGPGNPAITAIGY